MKLMNYTARRTRLIANLKRAERVIGVDDPDGTGKLDYFKYARP